MVNGINTKHYKMDSQTRRREIILGRLRGESTGVLSLRLGISRESVCKAYRGLPKRPANSCDALYLRLPPIDENNICSICLDYLDGVSEEKLMRKYELSLNDLMACFYAVTDRKLCYNLSDKYQKFIFSSVIDKMHMLNLSMPILANRFHQSIYTFELIMKGWEYLPYEIADKLAAELDLSVSEVCKDIMVLDDDGETTSKDRTLIRRLSKTYFYRAALKASDTSSKVVIEAVYWAYYTIIERKMEVLD